MLSAEEVARRKEEMRLKREWKRRQKRRNLLSLVFLVLIGLVAMGFSAYYSYKQGMNVTPVSQSSWDNRRTNILFLGIDKYGDQVPRTDTIIVASIDPTNGRVSLLSIPRDTRVFISDRQRWDRLNAAYVFGGPQLTVQTVASFLGVKIDYYVQTDFTGFSQIVDTLGGVEVTVDREMYYVDNAQDLHIHLLPGHQHLDGEKSLQYVRYRDRLGDVSLVEPQYQVYDGRVERQRKFMIAVIQEILQARTIPKLPKLIGQLWSAVDTNLPWDQAFRLVLNAERFSAEDLAMTVVPGTAGSMNGASYWIPDEERLKAVVNLIFYGRPLPLRMEVLNGSGGPGVAASVGKILQGYGYDVMRLSNADHSNYETTQIIIRDKELVARLQPIIDVLDATVRIEPDWDSRVDITVIVGMNFN